MARIRSLNIGFFQNEQLAALGTPTPQTLFAGLWLIADREGRLLDRPNRIRGELFPHNPDFNVDASLAALETAGFIKRYEADCQRVIQITSFLKHQRPHLKEKPSELPKHDLGSATSTNLKPADCPPVFGSLSLVNGSGIGNGLGNGDAPPISDLDMLLDRIGLNDFNRGKFFKNAQFDGVVLIVETKTAAEWIDRHYLRSLSDAAGQELRVGHKQAVSA